MIINSEVELNSAQSFGFRCHIFSVLAHCHCYSTNCGSSGIRQQDSKWMLMLLHVCWKVTLTHIPIRKNSVRSQLRSYFCPLPSLTMTPVVKYQWRKEEAEALLVHLSRFRDQMAEGTEALCSSRQRAVFPGSEEQPCGFTGILGLML